MKSSRSFTAMSPVGESMLGANWSPPCRQPSWRGLFVAVSLPSSLSTLLELPLSADRRMVRSWLAAWFEVWLAEASEANRSQPASFLYLVLCQVPQSGDRYGVTQDGPAVEFGFGTYPHAPEEWVERPVEELVAKVITEL